jgi:geranylgeranyl diphosphate synthase type II
LNLAREQRVKSVLKEEGRRIDHWLWEVCREGEATFPPRLLQAMEYSLLAGGKRLRPILCLLGARLFKADAEQIRAMAVALEMLHTASLIHDDLPCMDNDTLRRGKPTNHVVFGEGMALLAGDALLVWSFQEMAVKLQARAIPPAVIVRAIAYFATAVGPAGVCGGQVYDSDPQSQEEGFPFVRRIATDKTAKLIQASLVCGALLAGAEGERLEALESYGLHLGLAFQIVDDILDVSGATSELGKTIGKDEEQGKKTFVRILGLDGARRTAQEETERAVDALSGAGEEAEILRDLALWLQDRSR